MLIKSERYINMAAGIFEIQSLWQHRASISIGLSVHVIFMNSEKTIAIICPFGIHLHRYTVVSSIFKYTKCDCAAYDRHAIIHATRVLYVQVQH